MIYCGHVTLMMYCSGPTRGGRRPQCTMGDVLPWPIEENGGMGHCSNSVDQCRTDQTFQFGLTNQNVSIQVNLMQNKTHFDFCCGKSKILAQQPSHGKLQFCGNGIFCLKNQKIQTFWKKNPDPLLPSLIYPPFWSPSQTLLSPIITDPSSFSHTLELSF